MHNEKYISPSQLANDLAMEEQKRLSLQHHLQHVKDPAALHLLRQLEDHIEDLRSSTGRQ